MQYPLADIVAQVRVILEQNQAENTIIAEEDNTLKLDEVIRQKILHAARHLLETSDVSAIDYGRTASVTPTEIEGAGWGELSAWVFTVPSDYLRLLTLKMSDWRRAVHGTLSMESPDYSQLQSGFVGLTGNPERPVVAEGQHIDATHTWRGLEIYTSAAGEVSEFRYCPIPAYETVDNVVVLNFPERLYRMLLYQTGSLVAATYKDSALAQLLMNMVYEGEPETKDEQ